MEEVTKTKVCTCCKKEKPIDQFRSRGGKLKHLTKSYCNTCLFQKHKKWVNENPERVKEYREKDPWTLFKRCKRRGITVQQLIEQYELQSGNCEICKSTIELSESAIDHNHKTGEFRGLLCKSCNRAIGLLKDNPVVLENAASYLKAKGHKHQ